MGHVVRHTERYLHQIWSVAMYDGTKCQAVPKGRGHVPYVHIVLALYPTPLLESLQRSHRSVGSAHV